MASPWKFLARLISPGRDQKRENGSTDEVTPDALGIADPTETPAVDSLNSADRPASEELHRHDQSAAISAEPVHFEEAEDDGHDKVDREDAKILEAADPALFGGTSIAAARDVTKIKRTVEVELRKQRRRGTERVAIANVSQVFQGVHTGVEMNLDEEIRVLRGQLARKLKLQNAQLRKMLERFER
ncbi:hypothetical protein G9X68_17335 [Rhizobium sp. WYCCWR 11279]|uniref:hypothetical protein n=1 Tax=Rhizobium changzhiense TaxID=2692317 RepID=UPI0014913E64|nr:hypothetical protein [Rhizobium changzhiense]NNU48860.1 hypothetical protein [Rhizobium changzhiense]